MRVDGLRRLTGGASRETWSLDAIVERGGATETLPLILQRDVRGAAKALSRPAEFQLMRAAFDEGIAAPEPMWIGDDSIGAGESFLVRRVDGETLPRRLLREDVYAAARDALPRQLGAVLAQIHRIPLDKHGLATCCPRPTGRRVARRVRARALRADLPRDRARAAPRVRAGAPLAAAAPGVERRCRARRAAAAPTLVHGDFRIGNVLFGPEGLRVMLDWELAHIGDPAEDMGFICVRSWRFGGPKPVGGIGEREEFFAAYEAAGGARSTPSACGSGRSSATCAGASSASARPARTSTASATASSSPASAAAPPRPSGSSSPSSTPSVAPVGAQSIAPAFVRTPRPTTARPTTNDYTTNYDQLDRQQQRNALDSPHARPPDRRRTPPRRRTAARRLRATLDGARQYNARVAANVIRTVRRELQSEERQLDAEWQGLDIVLGPQQRPPTLAATKQQLIERNRELCDRIRAGDADAGRFRDLTLAHVRDTVHAKLEVSNPKWLEQG